MKISFVSTFSAGFFGGGAVLAIVLGGIPKTIKVPFVATAYRVNRPSTSAGKTIVFPTDASIPDDQNSYVHFPLQNPCDRNDFSGTLSHPPKCTISTAVTGSLPVGQYPYTVDAVSGPVPDIANQGRCRACCIMCQVVIRNSQPDPAQVKAATYGSGPNPAVEILIDELTLSGNLYAASTGALPGQTVKWFRSGTVNTDWTVTFAPWAPYPMPCLDATSIGSGNAQIRVCRVNPETAANPPPLGYKYTMQVGNKSGSGVLYVLP